MALTQDEAARAFRAGKRYVDLCDAYRATSFAHEVVLDRIETGVRRRVDRFSPTELAAALNGITERRDSTKRTYLTFVARRLQALSRLKELRDL